MWYWNLKWSEIFGLAYYRFSLSTKLQLGTFRLGEIYISGFQDWPKTLIEKECIGISFYFSWREIVSWYDARDSKLVAYDVAQAK